MSGPVYTPLWPRPIYTPKWRREDLEVEDLEIEELEDDGDDDEFDFAADRIEVTSTDNLLIRGSSVYPEEPMEPFDGDDYRPKGHYDPTPRAQRDVSPYRLALQRLNGGRRVLVTQSLPPEPAPKPGRVAGVALDLRRLRDRLRSAENRYKRWPTRANWSRVNDCEDALERALKHLEKQRPLNQNGGRRR